MFNRPTLTWVAERGRPEVITPVGQDANAGPVQIIVVNHAVLDTERVVGEGLPKDRRLMGFVTRTHEP